MSRILIVEDEEHLAQGLQFNLEAEGHSVEIAGDGRTAAARLEDPQGCFDLVLLDLMLPGMNGFEVARRARAAGNLLPILILTAKDAVQDLVRGLEEGADDYLTKPFRLDELLARVRGLLRRRRWDGVRAEPGAAQPTIPIPPTVASVVLRSSRRWRLLASGSTSCMAGLVLVSWGRRGPFGGPILGEGPQ